MAEILSMHGNAKSVIVVTGSVGKREVATLIGAGLAYDGACSYLDTRKILPLHKGKQATFNIHVVDVQDDISSDALNHDVCVITPIESDSAAYTTIFSAMKAGGVVIIAGSGDSAGQLSQQARTKGLSVVRVCLDRGDHDHDENDVWVERMVQQSDCSCVIAHIGGERLTYKINLPGQQEVLNSLLALAAIKAVHGDIAIAAINFASQQARAGFGREIRFGYDGNVFTLVDYGKGMNMLSLKAALDHMSYIESGKYNHRIAVLSDFDDSALIDEGHLEALQAHMLEVGITRVLTIGTNMAKLLRSANIVCEEFSTNRTLQMRLQSMARRGDVVLVMGTISSGLAEIIDALANQFDMDDDTLKLAAE